MLIRYFWLGLCDEDVIGIIACAIEVVTTREAAAPVKLPVLDPRSNDCVNLASDLPQKIDSINSLYVSQGGGIGPDLMADGFSTDSLPRTESSTSTVALSTLAETRAKVAGDESIAIDGEPEGVGSWYSESLSSASRLTVAASFKSFKSFMIWSSVVSGTS
jgi:hypothetical protein